MGAGENAESEVAAALGPLVVLRVDTSRARVSRSALRLTAVDAAALALVVTAAVIHAGWNFAAKRVHEGGPVIVWCYYTVGAVVFLPIVVVMLIVEHPHISPWWLVAIVGNAVLHIVYANVLQHGYTVGDLSVVYPLARGTGPLLSVLFAVLVFGERPGWIALVGAFLIVAGVLLIGFARTDAATREADPHAHRRRQLGVVFGLLTGAAIAAYTLWDAHAVTDLGMSPVLYFGAATVLQSILLAPVAMRDKPRLSRLWRDHKVEAIVVGLASPIAYLLVLYAMQRAPVSLVAPTREVSIVLGGLVGWLVLKEPDPGRRLAGALVVLAGIAAVAVG